MGWKACHVCDRCKKEYVEKTYKESIVTISRRTVVKVYFSLTPRETGDNWGKIVNIDLCSDCRKALYKFLKGEEIPT